jgi:tRNA(fMet)-specific endonuclease VapC
MLQFLLDTDHLTLYDYGHVLVTQRVAAHLPDEVGVSAVSIEESLRGRLAYLARAKDGPERIQRYGFLLQTVVLLCGMPHIPFDQASETQYQHLLTLKLRIGTQI